MFGLYMIGKNEKKSSPTLLLSCEPKKPRTKALKLVRECGILQDYPGVRLAESSQAPTALGQVRSLGCLNAADTDFVFFSPPTLNNVCGRPILVIESNNPDPLAVTSISQKATIGGFVRLWNSEYDDVYCGLTVAHAFEDELRAFPASTDVEFAFDSSDGEDDEDDEVEETEKRLDFCSTPGPLLYHLASEILSLTINAVHHSPGSQLVEQRFKPRSMLHASTESQIHRGM
jgi:peptide-N4-(N-acetyl-beta-glucosaminyl)asparagine amidase